MLERLEALKTKALSEIKGTENLNDVESIRVKYIGRKGELTSILRDMKDVPDEERPKVGKIANEIKEALINAVDERFEFHKEGGLEKGKKPIDFTLPGRRSFMGKKHPITLVYDQIVEIFLGMGFELAEGPEVELDYYNFEALNMPRHHPARDMQDTFYIDDERLLRTHTSPVQIRVMESQPPPVKIIAPGKVYRPDYDVSHSPMFHQVEGLMVGDDISMGDLKGVLTLFVHRMYGEHVDLRFRPSFFPFTEPSAEVDIMCVICKGKGCRVCSGTGWLEILGSGMVDPNVFKMVGYDPEEVTGFAFGMGIERIAMLKYGIDDIRLFFENDIRFLKQF
ncbi:MAG: phenylalanine--tRNA ligase subunit alpha [Deltaproteobacteria bacterium]|uniref:Phenylalanine--tRNA ligase alpha subunit n=1 Tax=Candidatus Zymogenus saltonus TaxID=2844893 RepID=A0A9D8KH63_9DELT|nr:phenylalanine--tRNA ligase subunit alpha [Candidatus Zymogenus saltonus]